MRYGVIRVFILSLVGFAVTSLLCGLSTNLPEFILARILQGFSAGPMLPIVQTLIQRSVPRQQFQPMPCRACHSFGLAAGESPAR